MIIKRKICLEIFQVVLRSASLDLGAIGELKRVFGFTFVRSVTDIIFLETLVIVNGTSHQAVCSLNTITGLWEV